VFLTSDPQASLLGEVSSVVGVSANLASLFCHFKNYINHTFDLALKYNICENHAFDLAHKYNICENQIYDLEANYKHHFNKSFRAFATAFAMVLSEFNSISSQKKG
jgi:hypothetical protein